MLESLNLALFRWINAGADLHGYPLGLAVYVAEVVIYLMPASLVVLWLSGSAANRQAAVRACLAVVVALLANQLIAALTYHPRPCELGIGHTYLAHATETSFPSDHGTVMFTAGCVLWLCASRLARRLGVLLLVSGVAVAWSRIFLGVHYPFDMIGALCMALVTTRLLRNSAANTVCALLVVRMESLYRRVLATPIARGWLRP